jgi:hypothetical protein
MARYIDADALAEKLRLQYCKGCDNYNGIRCGSCDIDFVFDMVEDAPTADVVEVADASEKIIRKKAEVSEYWQNDVKQYRALKGYSDIEHDTDNFLRGYNEAVEYMLAILDSARMDGDENDV